MNSNYICVSFDGLDTCGKTHTIKSLQDYFYKLGYTVKSFKDLTDNNPSNKSFATEIRNFLLYDSDYDELPKITTPFLISVIRLKMIHDIRAFINENRQDDKPVIILLDRYVHTTLAYNLDSELEPYQLEDLCKIACDILKPDLSILLDIDYETYVKRINIRGNKDKIESTLDTRFGDIRTRYLDNFYEQDPKFAEKYIVLDNNKFNNIQKCKDLITAVILSKEFDREFDVRI